VVVSVLFCDRRASLIAVCTGTVVEEFATVLNRLRATRQLDRIVIDECLPPAIAEMPPLNLYLLAAAPLLLATALYGSPMLVTALDCSRLIATDLY
jgi:hypothetical protein